MRILHLLDHSLPLHSGYTFRTRAILKAQQAAGMEVRGITGLRHTHAGTSPEEAEGLTFHRTLGQAWGPPAFREWNEIGRMASAVEALCHKWRPDILHAHSPALCGMAGLKVARKLGLPLVYEIRAFWEDAAVENRVSKTGSAKYRLTRALENQVIAGADALVTICDGLKQDLVARGVGPERITIMPNGVDLSLFGGSVSRDPALAAKIGLRDRPVIGFIGSFYDYEGLDLLIAAMPDLLARQPDAQLLLVGGGPCDAALQAQAAASPAAAAIHFTGRVPHEQVDAYYALIDVLAYPRKRSRLTDLVTPLKPLEAMAQGKLVAASDVGGHRELMTHGTTGTLFTPDDPADCASALAALLDQRQGWPAMINAGRAHVAANHDWAINIRRYQDVYQILLASQSISRSAVA